MGQAVGRQATRSPGSQFSDEEVLDMFGSVFEDAKALADTKRAKGEYSFNINGSVVSLNGEFPAQVLTQVYDSLKPTPLWQTMAFTTVLAITLIAPFLLLGMEKTNESRGRSCVSQAPIWIAG